MSHLPVFQDHIPNTKDGTSPSGAVPSPPFAHFGIDCLGPLYIKNVFQETEKACVCLFTCCATRAVHLELTRSMTIESYQSQIALKILKTLTKSSANAGRYLKRFHTGKGPG